MANETKLQEATRRVKLVLGGNDANLFVTLLDAQIDEWKESLVEAKGETRDELQGAIKRVRALLYSLHRNTVKGERKDGAYKGD